MRWMPDVLLHTRKKSSMEWGRLTEIRKMCRIALDFLEEEQIDVINFIIK